MERHAKARRTTLFTGLPCPTWAPPLHRPNEGGGVASAPLACQICAGVVGVAAPVIGRHTEAPCHVRPTAG